MPRKIKKLTENLPENLTKNLQIKNSNKKKSGGSIENAHFFDDNRLSTQENKDNTYNEIGIIHTCESVAINIIRSTATGFLNMFGSKGFDNTIFDKARNDCLISIQERLNIDKLNVYKVCNIRFEAITVDPSLITMNAYGTLLIKSKPA
jgi:hypothetical protein